MSGGGFYGLSIRAMCHLWWGSERTEGGSHGGKQREPIQLGEDDLRNAREVWAQLEENFRSLSAIAQRALGQDTGAYAASQEKTESSKEFFIFQPGSAKQIHCNPPGGPCYTMIDPPGITRECTF